MIAVIGCGNANRSDDGAGPRVIGLLRARRSIHRDVRLLDAGTDGMAVMFAARGCQTLIVADACQSGSPPGAVFELPGAEAEQRYTPALNLHDFRWDHALYAGRKMFRDAFPADVTVMLVEAETVDFGVELSPSVSAAVEIMADKIERMIRSRLAAAPPTA